MLQLFIGKIKLQRHSVLHPSFPPRPFFWKFTVYLHYFREEGKRYNSIALEITTQSLTNNIPVAISCINSSSLVGNSITFCLKTNLTGEVYWF